ncbi:Autoinducer 2 import ATP-binding protein LsrA [bioreactor metagenome]|uniref:Autoinducer 2 import ATP-binding protein LsrA n=1 Tax=bioreactor metagenome TaxID=1076179 RepID=A0A645DKQ6_9ZZZZ
MEILKALFRNTRLLILDEPTSMLTPQEIREFFDVLRMLRAEGHSIILIAHNLAEILEISDRVTILRDGKRVCTLNTAQTNERELSRHMIGRDFLEAEHARTDTDAGQEVLNVRQLCLQGPERTPLLDQINLVVHSGEILGIAGIDGNGQAELAEILVGIRRQSAGEIFLAGKRLDHLSIRRRSELGLAYIPSDRHQDGLVMDADVAANVHLRDYYRPPFAKAHLLLFAEMQKSARRMAEDYQVKTPSVFTKARVLSGGNQQKLILARELSAAASLTIACQPTRGLDIGATEYLRGQLLNRRNGGKSVLLISTDLGEILALSDRIAVLHGGRIMGVVENTKSLSVETLGLMMGGSTLEEASACR